MAAYAAVGDLEKRFRSLDADERVRAEVLLEDASTALTVELARVGKEVDPEDAIQAELLSIVACNMVKRVLASGTSADISQMSETRGPFSTSISYANPSADMYIREDERRWLGIPKRRARIGFIGPSHAPEDEA